MMSSFLQRLFGASEEEESGIVSNCCEKYEEDYSNIRNIDLELRLMEKSCLNRTGRYKEIRWTSYPETFEKESRVYSEFKCKICGREIRGPNTTNWTQEEVEWKEDLSDEEIEEYNSKVEQS